MVARSEAYGEAVAEHILTWSETDGGAVVENMGFPLEYTLTKGPAHWVPTSLIAQQQFPLLPNWGKEPHLRDAERRKLARCRRRPNTARIRTRPSTSEALEVYEAVNTLTPEQKRHCPLLVGRSHAVADTARPLDIDRPPGARP